MEINETDTNSKQCYKAEKPVYDNLQILINFTNSIAVLWNKYQIFIYEDLKFETAFKVFIPEYQMYRVLITDNYLLCVDTNGFVHIKTLKFKNTVQRQSKCIYQPKDQGIKACIHFSQDHSLSLKYENKYNISVNKINADFQEIKKVALNYKEGELQENSKDKYILAHKKIDDAFNGLFKKLFSLDKLSSNCHFIVLSIDKITVYGCLFDPKMAEEETKLLKLFSCPSEICSIEVIGTDSTYMLIPLKMGSVIKLKLDDLLNNMDELFKPQVTHMNAAIHKFAVFKDINTLLYTDGCKMWKAENVFSEQIAFSEFFVSNVYDFTQYSDSFICTTYNKLIYTIPFKDEMFWRKRKDDDYSSAEDLISNTDCMTQIFKEVERGKELSSQLMIEGTYLAAMSLSSAKHRDLMEKAILSEVIIYETFEEVMKRNDEDLTLTEDISIYFEPCTHLLHITVKVNVNVQAALYEIISQIMSISQVDLHVTISNDYKMLKTTTLKPSKTTFLIPIQLGKSSEINVKIGIVPIIPGTYNRKQTIWIDLFKRDIKLTAENFMKGNLKRSYISLRRPKEDLEQSILTMTAMQYGQQFGFTDMNKEVATHSMYVRLPQKITADNFANYFSYTKSDFMIKSLSSEDFLASKSKIHFKIGRETVEVALENDGFSNPQLKITSRNVKITNHIRNFFSDIVYGENECKPGEQFVSNSFYTTVENLQMAVKDCVTTGDFKRFKPLMEQFDKDIIAVLPI